MYGTVWRARYPGEGARPSEIGPPNPYDHSNIIFSEGRIGIEVVIARCTENCQEDTEVGINAESLPRVDVIEYHDPGVALDLTMTIAEFAGLSTTFEPGNLSDTEILARYPFLVEAGISNQEINDLPERLRDATQDYLQRQQGLQRNQQQLAQAWESVRGLINSFRPRGAMPGQGSSLNANGGLFVGSVQALFNQFDVNSSNGAEGREQRLQQILAEQMERAETAYRRGAE
jgi:hypothetical protein